MTSKQKPFPQHFRELATRYRNVETKEEFAAANARAGQVLFDCFDAEQLENPCSGFERPQALVSDLPGRSMAVRYELSWLTFVGMAPRFPGCPVNPDCLTFTAPVNGVSIGTPGEWQTRAANYADLCDWLADDLSDPWIEFGHKDSVFKTRSALSKHLADPAKCRFLREGKRQGRFLTRTSHAHEYIKTNQNL